MNFARRILTIARQGAHNLFMAVLQPIPGDRILDIGTSDDTGPDSSMLERLYPHREHLTCASLTDGKAILAAYPGVHHIQINAGEPLPFNSNSFDIVYSNAMLEHVGPARQQKKFVEEMGRVASRRFLAVPNRGFPIEHHTCLPFIHCLPKAWFRRLLQDTRYDFWSHEENLNYVSAQDLRAMWPADGSPTISHAGIGFGFWSSNLAIYQTKV